MNVGLLFGDRTQSETLCLLLSTSYFLKEKSTPTG